MAKPKDAHDEPAAAPVKDPLIMTVSEIALLSAVEKDKFRMAGGTVTSDPVDE